MAGNPTIQRQAAPPAAALSPRFTSTAANIPSVNITCSKKQYSGAHVTAINNMVLAVVDCAHSDQLLWI
jgi:hypothetical protein